MYGIPMAKHIWPTRTESLSTKGDDRKIEASIFRTAMSVRSSLPTRWAVKWRSSRSFTSIFSGVLDDMEIGVDIAVRANDEAGALAADRGLRTHADGPPPLPRGNGNRNRSSGPAHRRAGFLFASMMTTAGATFRRRRRRRRRTGAADRARPEGVGDRQTAQARDFRHEESKCGAALRHGDGHWE